MAASAPSYAGIQQLSKEFAITIPKARNALMAGKIMTADGKPVKSTYAIEQIGIDDKPWYRWDRKIAFKAFHKAGLEKPSKLQKYSHIQSKWQASKKLDDAFTQMGVSSKLEIAYENNPEKFHNSFRVFSGARVHDNHAIGGPAAVFFVSSKETCAVFIVRLHKVVDDYELSCKSNCKTLKQIEEVEFYADAIRRVADWVQLQFFR